MPLHLLGKKSWNVYNPENIARVRRDEAQAKAQEEEDERRMQEVDAERRIRVLRGESPPTPLPPSQTIPQAERKSRADITGSHRKRRRLAGEDDTDRDIRLAREDAELALAKREELLHARKSEVEAPLHDSDGHINLFPEVNSQRRVEKNPEAVKEAADRVRCYEDQYTMRFSNAAGFRQDVGKNPWYSSSHGDGIITETMSNKDVWGNEDPLRKEREVARINLNDPLAAMKKGIRQLKSVEEQRKKWNEERRRELDALKSAEETLSRHPEKKGVGGEKGTTGILTIEVPLIRIDGVRILDLAHVPIITAVIISGIAITAAVLAASMKREVTRKIGHKNEIPESCPYGRAPYNYEFMA
ncbi:hypothetical protein AN3097.2 [Aspergillus nidulans FGSC A4]|uniref:CBF1-interacting co-repressor CIR N-terminal domain-containing protein n=1 Tax=Emericella nidulans (strain FGSC A4 / ATCC 38163 / CBS 112.46 / NRRL 194 / M139) TaxID=227321 RepID=Q5B8N3_EMENI|nr:hypothetical protein [Aspergillus nidulans FGSC A4]EAA63668.1 hypothetical protein AN3097.2 [Aspergillus nidulans FGSC A4]CBF83414.1 TPA: conserved hypothetical protein [Aspergillus nidulans FGSC A4]|eukprot:XP_660701.1 hypothetical protein AN3097.2 [Aspergillus nidulans FGSC A4]